MRLLVRLKLHPESSVVSLCTFRLFSIELSVLGEAIKKEFRGRVSEHNGSSSLGSVLGFGRLRRW